MNRANVGGCDVPGNIVCIKIDTYETPPEVGTAASISQVTMSRMLVSEIPVSNPTFSGL